MLNIGFVNQLEPNPMHVAQSADAIFAKPKAEKAGRRYDCGQKRYSRFLENSSRWLIFATETILTIY